MNQEAINNKKSVILFDNGFIETTKTLISDIIKYDDAKKAFDLFILLKNARQISKKELAKNQKLDDFYGKILITLKFVALPLLDDEDALDLIKYHFTKQFLISDYDLSSKFIDKLKNILVIEERDVFKKMVSAAILENSEKITKGDPFATISNWLKNYISQIGLNRADVIKKTQYLVDLKKYSNITIANEKKLKTLFNFYNMLKISSQTPEGFEMSLPVISDNKLYIFKQGIMEAVPDIFQEYIKLKKLLQNIKETNLSDISNLEQLKQLAAGYPLGSFERKAVEEEMGKLEGGSSSKK